MVDYEVLVMYEYSIQYTVSEGNPLTVWTVSTAMDYYRNKVFLAVVGTVHF